MTKVLAVASGGGHWMQLLRMRRAFESADISYITTHADLATEVQGRVYVVRDANMWSKLALMVMFVQVAALLVRLRPDIVITTGAAPGFAAVLFGRLLGARTVWIDSIANSEVLSSSGQKAGRWAHVWLTQWEHLARPDGPQYWGAVL